jgi:tetratricopeptide (TPR) repeat protein
MAFSKLIRWTNHYLEKISIFHVILLNCLFALISIISMNGCFVHAEMNIRLPFYLSDTPLLNKIFDSQILEGGDTGFRARELSYLIDFINIKFIKFSIENGFPHFLSITHYLFSVLTGCILWLFCVRELKLKPLIGIGWLILFWTSPSIFLGGYFFRSGKMGVALLLAMLFYVIYKVAAVSKEEIDFQISKKVWILYSIAIFTITFLDEQGLFFAIVTIVFLAIWGLFVRHRNIYIMLVIGVASILLHLLYKYGIAPQLTFMLNGYWPDFDYQKLPIQAFIQDVNSYMLSGLFLYVETFRFLIGNPPIEAGYGLLIIFIFFPVIYLYTSPGLSSQYKKYFTLALIGLLITNLFLVVVMNALMVLRHPFLISEPDLTLTYYWLPTNVLLAMTLALLTDIFYKSRITKGLVLMVMCLAIIGNTLALPKHSAFARAQSLEDECKSLLNVLKNIDSSNDICKPSAEAYAITQFFKYKKKSPPEGSSAHSEKGVYYSKVGQYRQAIMNFNKAIILNPNDIQSLTNRGYLYFRLRQYQRANDDFNQLILLQPNDALVYYTMGIMSVSLLQYEYAIGNFTKAIDLNPDYADSYSQRGAVYAKLGQNQLVIDDFSKLIRLRPNCAYGYNIRGSAYINRGNNDLGCRDLQKGCELGDCKYLELAKVNRYCR